ncbi:SCP2 sterol-binding domain-containing protein [Pseudoalteromonas shioyasakiensis]|uniref:Ubiquinone biosynthesis accessory factor UbiJ n=1 Tax=Pseudoalteromonas shioyasakiensis TaxID=1190813 RepID=A0ABT6U374_9GAMM|nr:MULTISPECIES: SCP2 sterol-binding domain-containing protein [Pseudoalteromonas]MDI4670086.1 SCP2 sterol-binding domain-containing protein [Pseudoalteromonas shioyasakiensis]MDI4675002.1 SCP2 sterol-binding domain-containing protein [Pseudoalteromonas shioyasakiensis]MDI4686965.1 SCP2 sterol-binding domain-containing protein [Pseudoalteromonas shioyasakiensis]MDI4705560.1 SCP2 sterol-binding domain-containing protein [Pseudoalteromonas shioyasakiensis]NUJ22230.1 SCP2 sterol-binding domain-co
MLANALLSLVERIINQLLQLDPQLQGKLAAIADKQLLIEIRDWQQSILCVYSDEQIHLYSTQERCFDCMISADIDTLLALKDPSMLTQLIRQDKLDLQGDLNLAQGFSNAFAELDIDWPEHFSRYIGDAPAQQLWLSIQALKRRGSQTKSKLENTLTTLCQDELAVTIHPLELAEFKQQNRQLKSQVSQLEMRINALLQSR